ncbi:MAG: TIM barrel protein [Bryobacteraceae bacterium]
MSSATRRTFLRGSLTATAAAAASPALSAAPAATAPAPALPMRVSVMAYSFHGLLEQGRMDIFGFLETCKYRYHLDTADLWNGFLKSTDEAYLKKIVDELNERELIVPNLAVDAAHVWADDPAQREKQHQNALAHLNAGRILGARFVRVDAGQCGKNTKEWTDEAFDHIVKRYREYAQYAHDHGFKAGAEVHWGPESWWPSMKKLIQAVNHPGFGVCCHISGFRGTKEEVDIADREIAPWVVHTHIDWDVCSGPLVEKLNNLRNAGYQGYYSVEHHSARNEYAETEIQLAKVRAVLQSWRTGGTGVDSYHDGRG